jgi:hypothetical protein
LQFSARAADVSVTKVSPPVAASSGFTRDHFGGITGPYPLRPACKKNHLRRDARQRCAWAPDLLRRMSRLRSATEAPRLAMYAEGSFAPVKRAFDSWWGRPIPSNWAAPASHFQLPCPQNRSGSRRDCV